MRVRGEDDVVVPVAVDVPRPEACDRGGGRRGDEGELDSRGSVTRQHTCVVPRGHDDFETGSRGRDVRELDAENPRAARHLVVRRAGGLETAREADELVHEAVRGTDDDVPESVRVL